MGFSFLEGKCKLFFGSDISSLMPVLWLKVSFHAFLVNRVLFKSHPTLVSGLPHGITEVHYDEISALFNSHFTIAPKSKLHCGSREESSAFHLSRKSAKELF